MSPRVGVRGRAFQIARSRSRFSVATSCQHSSECWRARYYRNARRRHGGQRRGSVAVCLSVCLSVCLMSVCLSVCPSLYLSLCLSLCVSALPGCLSACLQYEWLFSVCLCVCLHDGCPCGVSSGLGKSRVRLHIRGVSARLLRPTNPQVDLACTVAPALSHAPLSDFSRNPLSAWQRSAAPWLKRWCSPQFFVFWARVKLRGRIPIRARRGGGGGVVVVSLIYIYIYIYTEGGREREIGRERERERERERLHIGYI